MKIGFTFEGRFGFAQTQVSCLLQRGQRVIDSTERILVGIDVEVANRVVNEL